LEKTHITKIYVNGHTAYNLYRKYLEKQTGLPAEYLPSTSPANAAMTFEKLYDSWSTIIK
ncbi:MAG: DNA-deoxyinosine glycosylase, partial [Erysipelotrichaceae bacterium]|nr:DNA-deoxyinosine glycosylase [Erysipelotrichaceae bacterium]